ncbi:MAG: hypothetical protein Kow00129_10450 [Thermoleophilia bacterium]
MSAASRTDPIPTTAASRKDPCPPTAGRPNRTAHPGRHPDWLPHWLLAWLLLPLLALFALFLAPTAYAQPATENELVVETVATGLHVPWEMRFEPSGTLLVTERNGNLARVNVETGSVTRLGSIPAVETGEAGLLGFDLDPDYPSQPYIYVSYTRQSSGGLVNRVSRFRVDEGGVAGERVLVDGIPAGSIHDGSRVAFGPDGYLWVTTGDAGISSLAQDTGSPAGKVLRMDRNGDPVGSNPFPGSLVYSYGHRNPQGMAWHSGDVNPFLTEHGPDTDDEVNHVAAGGNFGWPVVRGFSNDPRFRDPLRAWTPTIAPAGAVFYEAGAIPGWGGSLLFVTLKERDLRRLTPADPDFTSVAAEEVLFDGRFGRLRSIAVGPDGALYLGTSNRDGRGTPAAEDDRILRVSFGGRSPYTDVPAAHPFFAPINGLTERGVVQGYGDGRFGVNDSVLRAQLAKMAVLAFALHTQAVENQDDPTFADVTYRGDAYPFDYVEEAARSGLVRGYGNGLFGPFDPLLRVQLVRVVVRAAGDALADPPVGYDSGFGDVAPEDREVVTRAEFNGLVDGVSPAEFVPYATATRGHAAKVLFQALPAAE